SLKAVGWCVAHPCFKRRTRRSSPLSVNRALYDCEHRVVIRRNDTKGVRENDLAKNPCSDHVLGHERNSKHSIHAVDSAIEIGGALGELPPSLSAHLSFVLLSFRLDGLLDNR